MRAMRRIAVMAAIVLVASRAVAALDDDESGVQVHVGAAAIAASMAATPTLQAPVLLQTGESFATLTTILAESGSTTTSDLEAEQELDEIASPAIVQENQLIRQNEKELAAEELLAHQMGAPVLSELEMEHDDAQVRGIERSLMEHKSSHLEVLHEGEHLAGGGDGSTSLLESGAAQDLSVEQEALAAIEAAKADATDDATMAEIEELQMQADDTINMLELGADASVPDFTKHAFMPPKLKLTAKHDYAYIDDPKYGGKRQARTNLRGLDIYVVNTQNKPMSDNENNIRPVAPPHPMSAMDRERARLAALMRAKLIHNVPQPVAAIKPRTRINTLSAYESSIVDSRPLRKHRRRKERMWARRFADPLVGGMGAVQLHSIPESLRERKARFIREKEARGEVGFRRFHDAPGRPRMDLHGRKHLRQIGGQQARFAQLGMDSELPGTGGLDRPFFPKNPKGRKVLTRLYGKGSSFDNRDGPPRLLTDLLPIKATMVEDLDPLGFKPEAIEPKPMGW